jgi:hypothetical protein
MGVTSDAVLIVKPRITDRTAYDLLQRKAKISGQPRRVPDLSVTRSLEDLESQMEALVVRTFSWLRQLYSTNLPSCDKRVHIISSFRPRSVVCWSSLPAASLVSSCIPHAPGLPLPKRTEIDTYVIMVTRTQIHNMTQSLLNGHHIAR